MTGRLVSDEMLHEGDVDLFEVLRRIYVKRVVVIFSAVAFSAFAAIVSLLIPNRYEAEAVVVPNANSMVGSAGLAASQYSGLASFVGIDLGGQGPDRTRIGLEVLKSRKFLMDFIRRHDLKVPIVAGKGWDRESGDLIVKTNWYDPSANEWIREPTRNRATIPSDQEALEEFMDLLSVKVDGETGVIRISIEFYSPTLARDWVSWLVHDLNEYTRQKDIQQAEKAIEYLDGKARATSLAGLQSVLFSLIEEQTKTVMLASVTPDYLLTVVDPPLAPEEKSSPARALLVLVFGFLGGLLAVIASISWPPRSEPVN